MLFWWNRLPFQKNFWDLMWWSPQNLIFQKTFFNFPEDFLKEDWVCVIFFCPCPPTNPPTALSIWRVRLHAHIQIVLANVPYKLLNIKTKEIKIVERSVSDPKFSNPLFIRNYLNIFGEVLYIFRAFRCPKWRTNVIIWVVLGPAIYQIL